MRVFRVAVVLALVLAARPAFALCVVGDTGRCHIGMSACDVDTFCDGNGGPCPSGIQAAAGLVCRGAVAGGCDVAEVCDGVSASCPADAHQPVGTVCRQAVPGGCDIAESCNGSASCPADAHQPVGTMCRQ